MKVTLTQILALALGLSALGHAWQHRRYEAEHQAYLGVRDERTEANGARDQALAAAKSCSDSVQQYEQAAQRRAFEGLRAREIAEGNALGRERRAQQLLAAKPSTAGDECRSADDAINAWLQARGKS